MKKSKYILYRRTSSGLTVYKCDVTDGKHGHITKTTNEYMAQEHDGSEVLEMAADREWFIKAVHDG
jgi:hypothetical protein